MWLQYMYAKHFGKDTFCFRKQNPINCSERRYRPTASQFKYYDTDNPFYTDIRYNDRIRYDDNLTVTKPLKSCQLVTNYTRILCLIIKRNICFGYVLESPQ